MHVGVAGVIGDVLVFQAGPGWAGDDFARLRLNVAEANFLVFLVQRQMPVIAAGDVAQRFPGFHRHLAVGFRRQRQDHFRRVYRALDLRPPAAGPSALT